MKGDRIEVAIDAGGTTRIYELVATRAGRRLEVSSGRGVVEVTEVTRNGTPVRTARFMASRILALVEYPAEESPTPPDGSASSSAEPTPGESTSNGPKLPLQRSA